jgi:hypothetical protein
MDWKDAQKFCGCSCCTLQRKKDAAWEEMKGRTVYADTDAIHVTDEHPGADPIPDYDCTCEPHETICPSCERNMKTTAGKLQLNAMYGKASLQHEKADEQQRIWELEEQVAQLHKELQYQLGENQALQKERMTLTSAIKIISCRIL